MPEEYQCKCETLRCKVCGKSADVGVALFCADPRNPDAIWVCKEHLIEKPMIAVVKIDPTV